MNIDIDAKFLRPLIQAVVQETLAANAAVSAKLDGRLAFTEPEAAALLGVRSHVLRDARLRGKIEASTVGKRIVYTRQQLQDYLDRQRWEPVDIRGT